MVDADVYFRAAREAMLKAEKRIMLADNEVLDPEGPDEMFEPLTRRGLFRRPRRPT